MNRVLIYEPDGSGHRMNFVEHIVNALAARSIPPDTLLITTAEAAQADWIGRATDQGTLRLHLIDALPRVGRIFSFSKKIATQDRHTRALKAAIRDIGAGPESHLLVPFFDDYCLYPAAFEPSVFSGTNWSGIAIRPRFHLREMGVDVPARRADRVEKWAYRRALKARDLRNLFTIDPLFAACADDPRVSYVADPADFGKSSETKALFDVCGGAVVLLVYGYIDHRKAIDRLLRAARDPRVPQDLVVALVGEPAPGMSAILEGADAIALSSQGRLVEVSRRVSEAEEWNAFERADIAWAFYPGSYCSSGAMVRAGQSRTPLLSTKEGLVGHLTGQARTGLTVPEGDDDALVRAIAKLAGDADLRATLGQNGYDRFAADTAEAFGNAVVGPILADPVR